MPDFDKLYESTSKLAKLTSPEERQIGLVSWSIMVGQLWQEIIEQWGSKKEEEEMKRKDKIIENLEKQVELLNSKQMNHDRVVNGYKLAIESCTTLNIKLQDDIEKNLQDRSNHLMAIVKTVMDDVEWPIQP